MVYNNNNNSFCLSDSFLVHELKVTKVILLILLT